MSGGTTETADIPLAIVPDTQDGGFKVGIEISLDGGLTFKPYEFDTGGTGFWAADNPSWWPSSTPTGGVPLSVTYSSGITYGATDVTTGVTLEAADGTRISTDADVAQISSANKVNASGETIFTNTDWQASVSAGEAPLYGSFFGDFGVGLGSGQGLFGILPQLPGSLANGFIVSLGTEPAQGGSATGRLQLGLSSADIASFPTLITMNGQDTASPYPHSGLPSYTQLLTNGSLSLSAGTQSFSAATGLVWDTGAPSTEIHYGDVIDQGTVGPFATGKQITPGVAVGLQVEAEGGLAPLLNFTAGTVPGLNLVGVSTLNLIDAVPGYVNTGLQPFFAYDVMYDVKDGVLGLRPHELPCFLAGTRIAVPGGECAVESLDGGDLVLNAARAMRPVRWVGTRTVDCRRHPDPRAVLPVLVEAGAFGDDCPHRDLYLSPDHAIAAYGVLVPVRCLINGCTVRQVDAALVRYFHIELDSHDAVLAEGLPVETYLDTGNRTAFANGGSAIQLHPDFAGPFDLGSIAWEAASFAPLRVEGPEVRAMRAILRARMPDQSGGRRSA